MHKLNETDNPSTAEYWSVNTTTKQLALGRNTVEKLVKESGAGRRVGRRLLVHRQTLLDYVSGIQ